jgi:hypothetical protein
MTPETQPVHDRIGDALRLIYPKEGDAYAILDSARAGRVMRMLKSSGLEHRILYEGEIDPLIAEVAPYLVLLPKKSPEVRRLLEAAWGNSWGVFLASRSSIDALRRHLRFFLTVMTEKKKKLLFRFYDPRVLRPYLPSCTPAELQTFFGPIDQYVIEGEDPSQAHLHARADKEFKASTVKLGAES